MVRGHWDVNEGAALKLPQRDEKRSDGESVWISEQTTGPASKIEKGFQTPVKRFQSGERWGWKGLPVRSAR